jgi:hypothetical protein
VTLANILKKDKESKHGCKHKGRPRKIKEDPLEEEVADYNEWYTCQKNLQMELISQIDKNVAHEHKKEEEEAEVAEQQPPAAQTQESEEEQSETNEEDTKISLLETTKRQILKVLQPILDHQGIVKNIRKKKYLDTINED